MALDLLMPRTLWTLLRIRAVRRTGRCPWGCCTLDGDLPGPRLAERFIAYRREATDMAPR
ncbi:hypothetical protein [Streptomyces niveus]|uniref:hypothetical protein n=1 Tax=Streptomyces niveus TaxID=193462 RepID=UPI0033DFD7D6